MFIKIDYSGHALQGTAKCGTINLISGEEEKLGNIWKKNIFKHKVSNGRAYVVANCGRYCHIKKLDKDYRVYIIKNDEDEERRLKPKLHRLNSQKVLILKEEKEKVVVQEELIKSYYDSERDELKCSAFQGDLSPAMMASAGWMYDGDMRHKDRTKCIYCHQKFIQWNPDDVPQLTHNDINGKRCDPQETTMRWSLPTLVREDEQRIATRKYVIQLKEHDPEPNDMFTLHCNHLRLIVEDDFQLTVLNQFALKRVLHQIDQEDKDAEERSALDRYRQASAEYNAALVARCNYWVEKKNEDIKVLRGSYKTSSDSLWDQFDSDEAFLGRLDDAYKSVDRVSELFKENKSVIANFLSAKRSIEASTTNSVLPEPLKAETEKVALVFLKRKLHELQNKIQCAELEEFIRCIQTSERDVIARYDERSADGEGEGEGEGEGAQAAAALPVEQAAGGGNRAFELSKFRKYGQDIIRMINEILALVRN